MRLSHLHCPSSNRWRTSRRFGAVLASQAHLHWNRRTWRLVFRKLTWDSSVPIRRTQKLKNTDVDMGLVTNVNDPIQLSCTFPVRAWATMSFKCTMAFPLVSHLLALT